MTAEQKIALVCIALPIVTSLIAALVIRRRRQAQVPQGYYAESEWARDERVVAQVAQLEFATPIRVLQYRRRWPVLGLYEGVVRRGHPPMIRLRRTDGRVVALTPQWLNRVSALDLIADAARDKTP